MAVLKNLEGIKAKEIECEFFYKVSQILPILNSDKAATTASDNGAINIWMDDDGNYRCEMQRYLKTLESAVFTDFKNVKALAKEWLQRIK